MAYYKVLIEVWCDWDPEDSALEEMARHVLLGADSQRREQAKRVYNDCRFRGQKANSGLHLADVIRRTGANT